ncbi:uncharacterized protein LOC142573879 [Dermacentor variabilis]|uniref:uncharacterized protein LOC142573879 n=1 Tax=Dermacentor variabilis TaxID=34621 RepID=UPI003F5C0584
MPTYEGHTDKKSVADFLQEIGIRYSGGDVGRANLPASTSASSLPRAVLRVARFSICKPGGYGTASKGAGSIHSPHLYHPGTFPASGPGTCHNIARHSGPQQACSGCRPIRRSRYTQEHSSLLPVWRTRPLQEPVPEPPWPPPAGKRGPAVVSSSQSPANDLPRPDVPSEHADYAAVKHRAGAGVSKTTKSRVFWSSHHPAATALSRGQPRQRGGGKKRLLTLESPPASTVVAVPERCHPPQIEGPGSRTNGPFSRRRHKFKSNRHTLQAGASTKSSGSTADATTGHVRRRYVYRKHPPIIDDQVTDRSLLKQAPGPPPDSVAGTARMQA